MERTMTFLFDDKTVTITAMVNSNGFWYVLLIKMTQ